MVRKTKTSFPLAVDFKGITRKEALSHETVEYLGKELIQPVYQLHPPVKLPFPFDTMVCNDTRDKPGSIIRATPTSFEIAGTLHLHSAIGRDAVWDFAKAGINNLEDSGYLIQEQSNQRAYASHGNFTLEIATAQTRREIGAIDLTTHRRKIANFGPIVKNYGRALALFVNGVYRPPLPEEIALIEPFENKSADIPWTSSKIGHRS